MTQVRTNHQTPSSAVPHALMRSAPDRGWSASDSFFSLFLLVLFRPPRRSNGTSSTRFTWKAR
jgi:hypothetical protein